MKSITLAAENLNMQQPAVSLSVKELEAYYGSTLFERRNRKIYITENGKKLYDYTITILNQFYEAEQVLRNTDTLQSINVGSVIPVVPNSFVNVLKNFTDSDPNTRINAVVSNSTRIEELLLKNELDIGVIDHSSFSSSFHTRLIFQEDMLIVCGHGYRKKIKESLTLSELAHEHLLLRERGTGQRDVIDSVFLAGGYHVKPVFECNHIPTLIEAAICDVGILIISYKLISAELDTNKLCRLTVSNAVFHNKYHIAYHKNKHISSSMKHFISELEKSLNR